ncbi:MAG: lysostaphin resistance A-like protein [Polaribacter sp.]|uniref:CPBP family intramembrane glutamic endopeptidase n=1 Tax=Polaribacter sp. TaxID=1920175 RepID=UPI00262B0E8C|nr:CPBP family intramembrane glutamic endopeptidase [Polaribacter sp.]MBT3740694.1 CPBP family intramembrane metalloprotease [Polaribacter sp.]MDG1195900.1 lysostaphin resistance A-like protein [Polaribacter sp.]MDG1403247.1 lysostaphin resistance A-like protein [Polaribacter sp.]MDG2437481.1 lysostaphin resistance A-like protein [Polaribacter sp.]
MNYIQQGFTGKNEWYHWVLTIILVFVGWQIIGVVPLIISAAVYSENITEFLNAAADNFMTLGMNKNLFLFLMLIMFAVGLFFLIIAIKYIHKRTVTSIVTSRKNIDWKRFWFGFLSWGTIVVLLSIIGVLLAPENYTYNFNAKPFFILVAISIIFIPLQTSLEELLFRGYFMQGIGVLAKNKWAPLIITSVCFGLLHGANPEVQKLGSITMVFYIGTGFFYGITTLMDEGTELALGLHASNNMFAAFLITTDWTVFQTDALFIDTSEPSLTWEMFLPVFVLYPLILLLFAKKYGWKNWLEKLTGKVVKPLNFEEIIAD